MSLTPVIMGILNVTPNSFSDGGDFTSIELAVQHALEMHEQGATWIDIGGESTRPGAKAVNAEQELQRVIPVIEALHKENSEIKISIDTSKPEVMQAAVAAGAAMINDVCALQAEGAVELASELQVDVCLMHMQGTPRSMQENPEYGNVVEEVKQFLNMRADACLKAGIKPERITLDPGFGFGKSLQHNLLLLKHLEEFKSSGYKVLAGLSRKRMIGEVTGQSVDKRVTGSVACAILACLNGADIIRVHDVEQTRDALLMTSAVVEISSGEQDGA